MRGCLLGFVPGEAVDGQIGNALPALITATGNADLRPLFCVGHELLGANSIYIWNFPMIFHI